MITALTRSVSASIGRCELTHLARRPIDPARARTQHAGYEAALRAAGCEVVRLGDEPELPDAVFVEDVAVVLPEIAIVTRPGAVARRVERESIAKALDGRRGRLARIDAPATLDGGDVLVHDRTVLVGRSARSNAAATEQLAALLDPFGYRVRAIPVVGCLHLKSAVTALPDGRLLVQPRWLEPSLLEGMPWIEVDPDEPFAANALSAGGHVIYSASHPRTADRLRAEGYDVRAVDVSELEKAEGAVTCCSVLL